VIESKKRMGQHIAIERSGDENIAIDGGWLFGVV
jgi:hypothetical protein